MVIRLVTSFDDDAAKRFVREEIAEFVVSNGKEI